MNVMAYQSRFDAGKIWMQIPKNIPQIQVPYDYIGYGFEFVLYVFGLTYVAIFGQVVWAVRSRRESLDIQVTHELPNPIDSC